MTATHQPETKSPSRRVLLAGALGGIGAWAASAIGRASPVRAVNGAPGDFIHVGDTYSGVSVQTTLGNQATNDVVLWVASNTGGGFGGGEALVGFSDHGTGVKGWAPGGTGVRGISSGSWGIHGSSDFDAGVYGSSGTIGVSGVGDETGVHGESTSGIGVEAQSFSGIGLSARSSASNKAASVSDSWGNSTGVMGLSTGGTVGPTAKAKTGVFGYAIQDATATGVRGESTIGVGIRGKATTGYAGFFDGRVFTTRYYELAEITTPNAPAANQARLFVRDSGGKTQLCVRFHTGAVRVLTTEP
jgi:hypothetical protein